MINMEYTKEQLKDEIYRIKQAIYRNLDFDTRNAIMKRQMDLMDETGVNKTKKGTQRYYLPTSAKKEVVDDYLTTLINATYDTLGYCF